MMRPTTNAVGASLVCCFAIGAPPAAYRDAYDPAQPAVFQVAPHRLLMEAVAGRRVGDAVKIGMGRDRNTLALAERGWRGTGFDLPTQGIAQAKAVAVVRKLLVVALVANDVEIEYGEGKWVFGGADLPTVPSYPGSVHSLFRVGRASSSSKASMSRRRAIACLIHRPH